MIRRSLTRATRMMAAAAATVILIAPRTALAGADDPMLAVVEVKIARDSDPKQVLGTIVHVDPNAIYILAPFSPLEAQDTEIDRPALSVTLRGTSTFSASAPFLHNDEFDLTILTVEPPADQSFNSNLSPILIGREAGQSEKDAVVFDESRNQRKVDLVSPDPKLGDEQAGWGSPVFGSDGRIIGFLTKRGGSKLAVTPVAEAMRILRSAWHIPADKLIPLRHLRSTAAPLSVEDVSALMASPGYHLPSGELIKPDYSAPSDSPNMLEAWDSRLRDAALRSVGTGTHIVTTVARLSFHKYRPLQKNEFGLVVDEATDLAWLTWNSEEFGNFCNTRDGTLMTFADAEDCVGRMNEARIGGYRHWRLPTLDEIAGLLEFEAQYATGTRLKKYHIDPLFGVMDSIAWGADRLASSDNVRWSVCFFPDDQFMRCGSPIAWPESNVGRLLAVTEP